MKITGISAVTLFVRDMKKSCEFYSLIPGFRIVCGGPTDNFTSFEISQRKMYLNLELRENIKKGDFGRVIFYTDDVDWLYDYLKSDLDFARLGKLENKPATAEWGERYFHVKDPDWYELSFAMPATSEQEDLEEEVMKKPKQRYKPAYKKRYRQN